MSIQACPQCNTVPESATFRFCPTCGFPLGEVTSEEKAEDALLGKTIAGNYQLLELVGIGGMGRVYRAEQKALGRTVAVKVIHPHLHGEEGAAARFIAEARAASRLNHPNVVAVIDFGRTPQNEGNNLYLVMEFLRGKDLARILFDHEQMPFQRCLGILKQTLAALDEAHHFGIIHRDIKPENIVIEPTRGGGDLIKVVDFGLAKLRPDLLSGLSGGSTNITSPGIVCGTPDFMSPEQGRGDPLDARSDLYSLAVIFFQMLAGVLPFEANSPTQVVLMHLQTPPPDPRKVAPHRKIPNLLAELCLKGLEKDRNRRFADANEFARAIDSAMELLYNQAPTSGRSTACTQCGNPVARGQKFCGECGIRVTWSTPPEDNVRPSMKPAGRNSVKVDFPLPMIEREDDIQSLVSTCQSLMGVQGMRIVGDLGAGKSRLLAEFSRSAEAEGNVVVAIDTDPYGVDSGFYGLTSILRKLSGVTMESQADQLTVTRGDRPAIVEGLKDILVRPSANSDRPEIRRHNACAAFRWALEHGCRTFGNRLIVVADDLHRQDGGTRHAISDFLGDPQSDMPILIVAAHPQGFDHGWPANNTGARILRPLSLAALMQSPVVSARQNLSAALTTAVKRHMNPLLFEQFVRLTKDASLTPSGSLADLVTQRFERLSLEARKLLQGIAILGESVSRDLVATFLHTALDVPIAQCEDEGLIRIADGNLVFSHPIYREIIISTIPAQARKDFHSKAADLLTENGAPIEARAHHAFFAQHTMEALMLLEQVADRFSSRGDDENSVLALRRALELARRAMFRGDVDDPDRAVVIFSRKLGECLARLGSLTDADGVLREALDLAGPTDLHRARILETLAKIARQRDRKIEAQALIGDAISTAQRIGATDVVRSLQLVEQTFAKART